MLMLINITGGGLSLWSLKCPPPYWALNRTFLSTVAGGHVLVIQQAPSYICMNGITLKQPVGVIWKYQLNEYQDTTKHNWQEPRTRSMAVVQRWRGIESCCSKWIRTCGVARGWNQSMHSQTQTPVTMNVKRVGCWEMMEVFLPLACCHMYFVLMSWWGHSWWFLNQVFKLHVSKEQELRNNMQRCLSDWLIIRGIQGNNPVSFPTVQQPLALALHTHNNYTPRSIAQSGHLSALII